MAETDYNIKLILQAQNKASQEIEKVSGQISWMRDTLAKLWISAIAISSVKSLASSVLELWWNLEQAEVAYSTMLWSTEKAQELLANLSEFAKKTPFELTWVRESAKQLLAYWVSAEDMIPTMKTLWDLSAWLWVDISQLALVFWQVKTATKLTTNDLKQFINAWVPLLDQLSSQLKVSKWEISDMITKWQISFEMVEQALTDMTSAWWRFENLMEKQSWTFQWMLSNIHDSFDWIKESLGMAILPLLEKLLGIISPIIEKISDWVQEHQKLSAIIMGVVSAWLLLVWVLWSMSVIMPIVSSAISLLTGPIWIVMLAIWALATAWATNFWWIRDKTKEVIDFVRPYIESAVETVQNFLKEHGEEIKAVFSAIREFIETWFKIAFETIGYIFESLFSILGILIDVFKWDRESARTRIKDFWANTAKTLDKILTTAFWETRENIKAWFMKFYDAILSKVNELVDKIKRAVQSLRNAWNEAKEMVGWVVSNVKSKISWKKAVWWPVYQWQSYLVWENGPELFTPSMNGHITRNEDLWWMWNITIQMTNSFSVTEWTDQESLATIIAEKLTRQLSLYKKGIY